mmetsp:Transcript_80919/g.148417  ORF Transcript_80919/g.148417 Transcript_80919/m.148417 type:complete len:329 (-) Transcript_80919:47-1033(-)
MGMCFALVAQQLQRVWQGSIRSTGIRTLEVPGLSENCIGITPASVSSEVDGEHEHVSLHPWQRYEEVGELGEGVNGKVKLAKDRECKGRMVAIKRVSCSGGSKAGSDEREISILRKLDHENICKLLDTYEHGHHRYFIMEYLEGGELFDHLLEAGKLDEDTAKEIFRQVASAVNYAHVNGIAHRDLKPENICFVNKSRRSVKVIDWGHGAFVSGLKRTSTPKIGSVFYQAPEVQEATFGSAYTNACDLWSLGVLLYVVLSGTMTSWVGGTFWETLRAKKNEDFPMTSSAWSEISPDAKDLIKSLLKANPQERLSIQDVLLHPWLTTLG